MRRVWVVDSTTEKVVRLLAENPRGIICFRDELAGLLGGFDKYGGSGSDRAFWLEAYEGRPYRYDRVGLKDDVIDVPFNAVALIGGIQPDRLAAMVVSGDDDGLAARLIYAWPDPIPPRRPTKRADNGPLLEALRRLQKIDFVDVEGVPHPHIIMLEPETANEFSAWWQHKQWDAKRNASGKMASAVGKLEGVLLRTANVLEFLRWAWSVANTPRPEQVSMLSVLNAMRLIDEREARLAPKLAQDDPKAVDAALDLLVDAKRKPSSPKGGRPPKSFIVNPAIYQELKDADIHAAETVKTVETSSVP
jgi:putative DNA primase/helicase